MGTAAARPPAPPLPRVPLPDPRKLPADLQQCAAWIVWRLGKWEWRESQRKWKLPKLPCDRNGRTHDMTDPGIWSGLAEALRDAEALRSRQGGRFGVGVSFAGVGGAFFCPDLDGDFANGPSERLLWLMTHCQTWGERSISGEGVHLFYRGSAEGKVTLTWRGSGVEIFGSDGFVALTGDCLDASVTSLADGSELLRILHAETEKKKPDRPPGANGKPARRLLVDRWLHDRHVEYRVKDRPDAKGRTVYVLKECPFDPGHGDPDSCVMQAPDGQLSAHCFHTSCRGKGWAQFRDRIGKPEGHHWDPPYPKTTGGQAGGSRPGAGSQEEPRWPPPVYVSALSDATAVVDWTWHGCVAPGHLTLFSALMKCGKSTLLGHLLRSLQDGAPFLGRATRRVRTLLVTEESETIWCGRRDALGLDDHLSLLCRPLLARPNYADWLEFVAHVEQCAGDRECEHVAFDTLGAFAPWKSENDAAEVMGTMTPLNRLTLAGRAVTLFHHIGKADQSEGKAARGSTALAGAADILLELRRYKPDDRQDRRRVLTGLGRFESVPEEIVIELAADGSEYTAHGDKKATLARELADVILDILPAEGPGMTSDEVHEEMTDDVRPKRATVTEVLRAGAKAGSWQQTGAGKPKNPWRFWRGPG
jgi:AAA domain